MFFIAYLSNPKPHLAQFKQQLNEKVLANSLAHYETIQQLISSIKRK